MLNFNLKEPRRDGVPEEQKVKRLREEISLSGEEQHALLTEKGCLMEKLRERVHVSVQLQGRKLVLIGKPEKMEEAKEELRGILRESGELAKCADSVEKKLTYKKPFTRALTSKGGKLLKDIRKYSGTDIYFSHSSGGGVETVVLLGASESVVKAEQMLEELLASAEEICLSGEEREALLTRGKRCIMGKIQQKLQVPAQLQGQKMLLFGKPEETREAKEMVEEELKLVRETLSGR